VTPIQVYQKRGQTEEQSHRGAKPSENAGRAQAVHEDGQVDPRVHVSQLLIAVNADEDREEDAADLAEDGEEFEAPASPGAHPVRGAKKQDVINVHDHDLLQVCCS